MQFNSSATEETICESCEFRSDPKKYCAKATTMPFGKIKCQKLNDELRKHSLHEELLDYLFVTKNSDGKLTEGRKTEYEESLDKRSTDEHHTTRNLSKKQRKYIKTIIQKFAYYYLKLSALEEALLKDLLRKHNKRCLLSEHGNFEDWAIEHLIDNCQTGVAYAGNDNQKLKLAAHNVKTEKVPESERSVIYYSHIDSDGEPIPDDMYEAFMDWKAKQVGWRRDGDLLIKETTTTMQLSIYGLTRAKYNRSYKLAKTKMAIVDAFKSLKDKLRTIIYLESYCNIKNETDKEISLFDRLRFRTVPVSAEPRPVYDAREATDGLFQRHIWKLYAGELKKIPRASRKEILNRRKEIERMKSNRFYKPNKFNYL